MHRRQLYKDRSRVTMAINLGPLSATPSVFYLNTITPERRIYLNLILKWDTLNSCIGCLGMGDPFSCVPCSFYSSPARQIVWGFVEITTYCCTWAVSSIDKLHYAFRLDSIVNVNFCFLFSIFSVTSMDMHTRTLCISAFIIYNMYRLC